MKTKLAMISAVLLSTAALADSPHFVGKVTATLSGDDAQICWKEAGLGDNALINYTASGDATATFVCVNGGGQCPNAANKTTVNGPVSASGTFASGKNGTVSACLTLEPPGAGGFACPNGQTLTLASVSYSGLQIADTTHNVTQAATPTGLAVTPFTCP